MTSHSFSGITTVILDIEGTVCPLSFVHAELFPYFLHQVPGLLAREAFPVNASNGPLSLTLSQFPKEVIGSAAMLQAHITSLVERDIKDPTLKALQGQVWRAGYDSGAIVAPLFGDAVMAIKHWSLTQRVFIYSSGSIPAQKLLFQHVATPNGTDQEDLAPFLSGYYDITTAGPKQEPASYARILSDIGVDGSQVLFLSDNPKEVEAAVAAGVNALIVVKPGNHALGEGHEQWGQVSDFAQISL